jgi:hypothetical protein
MEPITTVCLVKPEAPRDAQSIDRMRWSIEQDAAREGSLIGLCLSAARARGLSEEDTYVFLAYHALLQLEETHQRHVYLSEVAPFLESEAPESGAARAAAYLRELGRRLTDLASRARVPRLVHRPRAQ